MHNPQFSVQGSKRHADLHAASAHILPRAQRTPRRLLPQGVVRGPTPQWSLARRASLRGLRRMGELQLPDRVSRSGRLRSVDVPRFL